MDTALGRESRGLFRAQTSSVQHHSRNKSRRGWECCGRRRTVSLTDLRVVLCRPVFLEGSQYSEEEVWKFQCEKQLAQGTTSSLCPRNSFLGPGMTLSYTQRPGLQLVYAVTPLFLGSPLILLHLPLVCPTFPGISSLINSWHKSCFQGLLLEVRATKRTESN